jgi:hypothetical protein
MFPDRLLAGCANPPVETYADAAPVGYYSPAPGSSCYSPDYGPYYGDCNYAPDGVYIGGDWWHHHWPSDPMHFGHGGYHMAFGGHFGGGFGAHGGFGGGHGGFGGGHGR